MPRRRHSASQEWLLNQPGASHVVHSSAQAGNNTKVSCFCIMLKAFLWAVKSRREKPLCAGAWFGVNGGMLVGYCFHLLGNPVMPKQPWWLLPRKSTCSNNPQKPDLTGRAGNIRSWQLCAQLMHTLCFSCAYVLLNLCLHAHGALRFFTSPALIPVLVSPSASLPLTALTYCTLRDVS